jgi:hypothetical protein
MFSGNDEFRKGSKKVKFFKNPTISNNFQLKKKKKIIEVYLSNQNVFDSIVILLALYSKSGTEFVLATPLNKF